MAATLLAAVLLFHALGHGLAGMRVTELTRWLAQLWGWAAVWLATALRAGAAVGLAARTSSVQCAERRSDPSGVAGAFPCRFGLRDAPENYLGTAHRLGWRIGALEANRLLVLDTYCMGGSC